MKKCFIMLVLAMLVFAVSASAQPRNDSFFVTIGPGGDVLHGGGTGYIDGTWYVYPSGWINEWFYDHPFDPDRGKIIHIEFDWVGLDPLAQTNITVAINWSTPAWSELGYGTQMPPLPGFDEGLYILRSTIFSPPCGLYPTVQHFAMDYTIWSYNPEWVSVDVMGINFVISNGSIIHDCVLGTERSSWGSIKAKF